MVDDTSYMNLNLV